MPVLQSDQTLAPAEQYLRALWNARWLYLLIVGIFVLGSVVVTALLPKTYTSMAIFSVQQPPTLGASGLLFDTVIANPRLGDGGGGPSPRRFLKRLLANRTVTLAARDAGILAPGTSLDDQELAGWVDADHLEGTDLITLKVNRPTAEGARLFAQKLLERMLRLRREENEALTTRRLIRDQAAAAEEALTAAEARLVEIETAGGAQAPVQRIRRERAAMDLDMARKVYVPLKQRLEVIELLLAEQDNQIFVVDPPTLPNRPTFPRPLLNVSIGLILGLLIATLAVIVRSLLSGPGLRPR